MTTDFSTLVTNHGGSLWKSEQPIIIRIHTTQNDNLQRAFAYLVFYGLYKDMFRRGVQDRITHALIFDEAHRAAGLKLIPTMAKECRKFGISLVLASQEARDFDVSVFSAIANYLVLSFNGRGCEIPCQERVELETGEGYLSIESNKWIDSRPSTLAKARVGPLILLFQGSVRAARQMECAPPCLAVKSGEQQPILALHRFREPDCGDILLQRAWHRS